MVNFAVATGFQEVDLNVGGLVGAVTSIEGTGQLVTGKRPTAAGGLSAKI